MSFEEILLTLLIFFAATLYASVGHGGASGYLAAMALLGVAPEVMRPTALTLNVLVSGIALFKYTRAGAFSWALFWPFALASMPFAYLGGVITLPGFIYKPLVGLVLLFAAWRFFRTAGEAGSDQVQRPPVALLLLAGALLGLLSGLTGVGGGIFLSPLLLFFRWAPLRVISGVCAAFILVNSLAGLAGVYQSVTTLPDALPYWALAAVVGGYLGAEFGSRRLANPTIQKLLAGVLVIAGVKMLALV